MSEKEVKTKDVGILLTGENAQVIFNLLKDSAESAKQYYFGRCTGIWCTKPARDRLEVLLESGQFTGRQLGWAWRNGMIGWDREKEGFAYYLGNALSGYVAPTIVFAIWVLLSFSLLYKYGLGGVVPVFGLGAFWLLVCAYSLVFVFEPRKTAKKVRAFEEDLWNQAGLNHQ